MAEKTIIIDATDSAGTQVDGLNQALAGGWQIRTAYTVGRNGTALLVILSESEETSQKAARLILNRAGDSSSGVASLNDYLGQESVIGHQKVIRNYPVGDQALLIVVGTPPAGDPAPVRQQAVIVDTLGDPAGEAAPINALLCEPTDSWQPKAEDQWQVETAFAVGQKATSLLVIMEKRSGSQVQVKLVRNIGSDSASGRGLLNDYMANDKASGFLIKRRFLVGDQAALVLAGNPPVEGSLGDDCCGSILTGSGAPSDSLGSDGNTYIDTDTGDMYQKRDGRWGSAVANLTGPAGNRIYSGSGDPSGITGLAGNSGDLFVDSASGRLYQKGATGWTQLVVLSGATGGAGSPGPTGPVGPQGTQGNPGSAGPVGATGVQGTQGIQGATGATGIQGATGSTGIQGATGATGMRGTTGATGIQGSTGSTGIQGATGSTGIPGKDILSDTGVPLNGTGKAGDQYINLLDYGLYRKNVGGTWDLTGYVKGATGSTGIQGATGSTGIQGATGSTGIPGKDILSDTGTPGTGVGKIGDQYINLLDYTLWKKTAVSTWTTTGNVQGATGATGARGITGATGIQGSTGSTGIQGATGSTGIPGKDILSDTGVPLNGTGKAGDQYINLLDYGLYRKNVGGTWDLTGYVKGATGSTGIQGATGSTGIQGATGSTGIQGATGSTGIQGSTGSTGIPGKDILSDTGVPSAGVGKIGDQYINLFDYGLYRKNSVGTWDLTGHVKGATGSTGIQGATGSTGIQGATGSTGIQGATGSTGIQGATGSTGIPGKDILSDTGAPLNGSGKPGDQYINLLDYSLYRKNVGGTWDLTGYVKGATGSTGIQGATGSTGIQGATGSTGIPGKDILSDTGAPSVGIGKVGDQYINLFDYGLYRKNSGGTWDLTGHVKGATGSTGIQGATGSTGIQGATGSTGIQGATGSTGIPGKDILSDTGVPAVGVGKIGDQYINLFDYGLYRKNAGGTWDLTGHVQGATGSTGIQGATGSTGIQGATGSTGIQGATGSTGIQGATGSTGIPGKDILSDTGTPGTGVGKVGDQYINLFDYTLWKKTGVSTWATTGNVQGATGATGARGITGATGIQGSTGSTGIQGATGSTGIPGKDILSDTGAPLNGTGKPGDQYINLLDYGLYRKNVGGTWDLTGYVKGATGSTGIQGATGSTGIQGATGSTGIQGATGSTGIQGATGSTGIPGKDILSDTGAPSVGVGKIGDQYINLFDYGLYRKNAGGTWDLTGHVKGATGSTGIQGATGSTGIQGATGSTGIQGATGSTGIQGATGSTGIQGATGSTGIQGATGSTGIPGKDILSDTGVPAVGVGKIGDQYINLFDYGLYRKNAGGTWDLTGHVKGATGSTGIQGATGSTGIQGATGSTGIQGATGSTGIQGATGSTGIPGKDILSDTGVPLNGAGKPGDQYINLFDYGLYRKNTGGTWDLTGYVKGATGSTGIQGATGSTGIQGATGSTGIQGATGSTGIQGATGSTGIPGKDILSDTGAPAVGIGKVGDQYINLFDYGLYRKNTGGTWDLTGYVKGATGSTGIQGATGSTGIQGATGSTGIQGATGSTGIQGSTGSTGIPGKDILSDTGTPGTGVGKVGDQYINLFDYTLWKKTGVTTWATTGNVQGATGATGARGITGATGIQGSTGSTGIQGATGSTGIPGKDILSDTGAPLNGTGKPGDQYINLLDYGLYRKNVGGTWDLTGYVKGATGSTGIQGATGSTGIQGATGSTGIQGATGSTGIQGATGSTGIPGKDILSDTGTPGTGVGKIGDQYINLLDYTLWKKTGTSTWATTGRVQGTTGTQGPAGATGIQGIAGNPGSPGSQGTTGLQGYTGVGTQGVTGSTGIPGKDILSDTGAPSPSLGKIGDQYINLFDYTLWKKISGSVWNNTGNVQGAIGSTGTRGITGLQGATGLQGSTGIQGLQGDPGTQGATGVGSSSWQFIAYEERKGSSQGGGAFAVTPGQWVQRALSARVVDDTGLVTLTESSPDGTGRGLVLPPGTYLVNRAYATAVGVGLHQIRIRCQDTGQMYFGSIAQAYSNPPSGINISSISEMSGQRIILPGGDTIYLEHTAEAANPAIYGRGYPASFGSNCIYGAISFWKIA